MTGKEMSSLGIRKRGKAWQIVIDVGTKEKRQQKVFTFYGTKPEARAEEARLKALYKQGSALPGKMTVEEYMLYWLDTYKKRKLAVRTYESYKETIVSRMNTQGYQGQEILETVKRLAEQYNQEYQ
jgi:hypothetical protein